MKDKNIALPRKAARYFYTERIVSGGLTASSSENKRQNTYAFRLSLSKNLVEFRRARRNKV